MNHATMTLIAAALTLQLAFASEATGQTSALDTARIAPVKNIIYAEVATMLIVGGLSVNYERMLSSNIALRTGLGTGYAVDFGDKQTKTGFGTMAMVNFITSDSDYRFEAGIGFSIMYFPNGSIGGDMFKSIEPRHIGLMPAASIGYRYQQSDGGFFFRLGATYTYFMATPIQVSIGHAF